MSILSFSTGDLFRITVVKYLATNPDRKWANNYELRAVADGVTTDLTTCGSIIVTFEQALHYDLVQFDRLRISTWEEDSVPYDPEVFLSLPLTGNGDLDRASNEMVALTTCWDVARFPTSGRFGHLFYRGCLLENEISAPAGKSVLTVPANNANKLSDAVGDALLSNYLDGAGTVLELVMINKTGAQVRPLISLVSRGVAGVPVDHGWFNRPSAP